MKKSKDQLSSSPNFLRKHLRTALAFVALAGAGVAAYEYSDGSGQVHPNPNVGAHRYDGIDPKNLHVGPGK